MFLKLLFIALVAIAILPFIMKEAPKKYLTEALTVFAIYQMVFITFHPMLGLICSVLCALTVLLSYIEMKKEDEFAFHPSILFCVAIATSLSLVTEFIETFAGRLF